MVEGYFPRRKGLEKGDPLSPFLFIILVEVLGRIIQATSRMGFIEGIRLARNVPSILLL